MLLFNRKTKKKFFLLTLAISAALLMFVSFNPTSSYSQTVDIPPCPSSDQFPKPGCFDDKDEKKNEDTKKSEQKTKVKKK